MLVLTRKATEKIVFPNLGVTVHILRSTGQTVRVGIDAPPEITVLREELASECRAAAPRATTPTPTLDRHALANAMSKLTLSIHLARKQWAAGRPAAADATLAGALQTLESLELDRATPTVPNYRALIVDDDANERHLLAGLLNMSGCQCVTAADGLEALDYLAVNARPDVVLLDMAMPRCDGPETLRRIRNDDRLTGLRVFSTSSTSPHELLIPDGPNGFDAWFPKPLDPSRLWAAIQSTATN